MPHGLQPGDLAFPFAPGEYWDIGNIFDNPENRSFYRPLAGHEGIDWLCVRGTPVYAMAAGTVTRAVGNKTRGGGDASKFETDNFYGNQVRIATGQQGDGSVGFVHAYAHLLPGSVQVIEGMTVSKGTLLGLSGNTGNSTTPHLHAIIKPTPSVTEFSIAGAIDFAPFLDWSNVWRRRTKAEALKRLTTPQAVNLRTAPGTRAPQVRGWQGARVTTAAQGTYDIVGQNHDRTRQWWQIVVRDDSSGWEAVGWVQSVANETTSGQIAEVPITAPLLNSNVSYPLHLSTPARYMRRSTSSGFVNVRSSAEVANNKVGRLSDQNWRRISQVEFQPAILDAQRRVKEQGYPWYKTQYEGGALKHPDRDVPLQTPADGWVRGDLLDTKPIPAPSNLLATPSGADVILSWDTPADLPEGVSVTGYRIWWGQSLRDLDSYQDVAADASPWPHGLGYSQWSFYALAAMATAAPDTDPGRLGLRTDAVVVRTETNTTGTTTSSTVVKGVTPTPTPLSASPAGPESGNRTNPEEEVTIIGHFRNAVSGTLEWFQVRLSALRPSRRRNTRGARVAGSVIQGWVPAVTVEIVSGNPRTTPHFAYLRLASWVTLGLPLRSGPGKAYDPPLQTLRDHGVWHRIVGKDAAHPAWWRIQVSTGSHGWVHAGHVDTRGDLSGVPVQDAASPPPAAGSSGEAAQGTSTASGAASGPYRNLETNPEGRWSVSKTGTEVTANFSSPRSPVQYYARQNPEPLFVLPVGFRPTVVVPHEASGTHVHEDRTEYEGSPVAKFDLTVGTNGELRYVNNSKVDHVGFLKYQVTRLVWHTAEAVAVPPAPTAPDIEATGTYHNQQVNHGSGWTMRRTGDAVSGTFTTTRSPVEYYANQNREALVWLPAEYWPERNRRFRVTGAVQVDLHGTAIADAPTVAFWVTVSSRDGRLYYDRDAALTTAGVGYLSYSLSVNWDAAPRVTVPSEPRDLEVDEVEADEVELDWRSPAGTPSTNTRWRSTATAAGGRWRTTSAFPKVRSLAIVIPIANCSPPGWRSKARPRLGPALEVVLADRPGIEVGFPGANGQQVGYVRAHVGQQFVNPHVQVRRAVDFPAGPGRGRQLVAWDYGELKPGGIGRRMYVGKDADTGNRSQHALVAGGDRGRRACAAVVTRQGCASGQQAGLRLHASPCGDSGWPQGGGSTVVGRGSQPRNLVQPPSRIPLDGMGLANRNRIAASGLCKPFARTGLPVESGGCRPCPGIGQAVVGRRGRSWPCLRPPPGVRTGPSGCSTTAAGPCGHGCQPKERRGPYPSSGGCIPSPCGFPQGSSGSPAGGWCPCATGGVNGGLALVPVQLGKSGDGG